ncbi:MAG: sulfatase-like hydrolase/transferase, partial [Verrucomicrobia bacterium]|nr:sulfatase-like hydrolase/transferase [Verrucomicrobiota bacterium]
MKMKLIKHGLTALGIAAAAMLAVAPAQAADKKPNILFIMGDDIGMWNIGAYHRGLMAGKTPALDKMAKEGMLFTDYYA